jgi:hypothetical protein
MPILPRLFFDLSSDLDNARPISLKLDEFGKVGATTVDFVIETNTSINP